MIKNVLYRIGGMVLVIAFFVGVMAFYQFLEDARTTNEIKLIAPPNEIIEGRVEKNVKIETYVVDSDTTEISVVYTLCSGKQYKPLPEQANSIEQWLLRLAPHKGCK